MDLGSTLITFNLFQVDILRRNKNLQETVIPSRSIRIFEGRNSNKGISSAIIMEACVFCAIIDGKAEGSVVYRDDIVIVFMDIQPVNPGHLLVCPLKHQVDFNDLDPEIGSYMFKIAQQMAQAIKKTKIKCKGINLFFADGEEADQEIFHAHLHVIPRYSGDGFMFVFDDSYYELPPRSELDFIATEIKHAL